MKKLSDLEYSYCDTLTFYTPPITFQEIVEELQPAFQKGGYAVELYQAPPIDGGITPLISCMIIVNSLIKLKSRNEKISVAYYVEYIQDNHTIILDLVPESMLAYTNAEKKDKLIMERLMTNVISIFLQNFSLV